MNRMMDKDEALALAGKADTADLMARACAGRSHLRRVPHHNAGPMRGATTANIA